MNKYAVPEIAPGVYALISRDWNRRVFDALAPTPIGTTYNSYLVRGEKKNALIDTSGVDYEEEYLGKVTQILGEGVVDYIIMDHAEPDHAGLILSLLQRFPARMLTTKRGAELATAMHHVPSDRIDVVGEDDTLDLGGKTLRFVPAPFIHWPETMMTFLAEDGLLFSCDFFGAHNPTGLFDDQAEEVMSWAKKYYGEIMMPYAKMGRQALEKIKDLPIAMIAPSHGPIYRHPAAIMTEYAKWTSQVTREKALVVYVTMYGSVETMVRAFTEVLMDEGVEVFLFDLAQSDLGDLAGHLVDSRALVFGIPTVLGGMHPRAVYAAATIKLLKPPLRYGVVLNSYGWAKHGLNQGLEFLKEIEAEVVGGIGVVGSPSEDDLQKIRETARMLAQKIKGGQ